MAGRLAYLETWLADIPENEVEVFLVHDIQDDKTGVELRNLIQKISNPNIFFSEGNFGTAGMARNSVLNLCKGTWIIFWDSDDIPHLENTLKAIDGSFDIIVGEFFIQEPNGERKLCPHRGRRASRISELSFQPGLWRILFRKAVINSITFPSFKMGEDQDFLAQVNWDEVRVNFSSSTLYTYNVGQIFQTTASFNSRDSLIDSLIFLSKLLRTDIGTERFIRNLASRQLLTLIKDTKLKMKLKAVKTFFNFLNTPKAVCKQTLSLIALLSYLVRTS
jgi:hypothetical protein